MRQFLHLAGEPQGHYPYTKDLQELERHCPQPGTVVRFEGIVSPLVIKNWEARLLNHPDKEFADYLIGGMTEGFHIGYDYSKCKCTSAKSNTRSMQSMFGASTASCIGKFIPY